MASLYFLGVLVLSIGIALVCVRKEKTALGIILGVLIIAGMEAYLQISLQTSIQNCIDQACEEIGLPPGCSETEAGCAEWEDVAIFINWVVGSVETIILLITVLVGHIIHKRHKSDGGKDEAVSSKWAKR